MVNKAVRKDKGTPKGIWMKVTIIVLSVSLVVIWVTANFILTTEPVDERTLQSEL